MPVEQLIALIGFVAVMTGTPGPNNLMLMASGANAGFRRSLPHILGIAFGCQVMLLCVALGLIGVVLPGMPTVVFMLVAAWAGARGWPRLESWLLDHPRYGPPILHWRERGAISRRGKCAASTMMLVSIGIIALSPVPNPVKIGVPVIERDRSPLHDRLNPLARLGFRPGDHPAQEMRNHVPERQAPTADIRRLVDQ